MIVTGCGSRNWVLRFTRNGRRRDFGRPCLSWLTKSGMTEPREYMTFPYRVSETTVEEVGWWRAKAWAVFSMSALVMPMALIG